jgi:hypothetical protein
VRVSPHGPAPSIEQTRSSRRGRAVSPNLSRRPCPPSNPFFVGVRTAPADSVPLEVPQRPALLVVVVVLAVEPVDEDLRNNVADLAT